MAKIKIAELDINTDALIKATADVKKEIDSLKQAQKELTKNGETSSKQFVKNAADLKVLSTEYNSNVKALGANTQAIADQTQRTELISVALGKEVESIKDARAQNKLLNKLRNEANVTTEEGRIELFNLNKKLDENNEFIKENADAYLQQKINVGNYKDSITEALGELNLMNGGISGFIARSKEAGGAGNLLKSSLGGAAKGFLGMTKASLSFIATPIGAVLAAIVLAFALVKNAMGRSEEATNKITKIFKTFSGIVSRLLKFLEPLGEFLIDGLVVGFELAGKAAEKALDIISSGLKVLGFDDAAKNVTEFKDEMTKASKAAQTLADAEAQLQKSQRESRKIQLDFQKDAEKLRQIRDDETKSFAERQKANNELGAVLKKQQQEELKIAQQSLAVANLRIDAEGKTTDLLDARAEALAEISDIQERITGQESEQLTNRVSLQKEANDKAIEQQKGALDLFIAQQGIKAKTLQEELAIEEQVSKKKVDILKAELNNKKITKTQFDAAVQEEENNLAGKRAEIAVDNADRELQAYIQNNQSKLDADKFFSDESLRIEQERIDGIAEKQRANTQIQLEQGVISQTEYNDAINLINEENRVRNEEAELLRKEAKAEADLIDLENQRILDEEKFTTEFDLATERARLRYEAEIAAAEKSGADTTLIKKKYDKVQEDIEKSKQDSKIAAAGATFGVVSDILGKETAAGKAAALAQALINTYQGITAGVALGYPAAIPAVAAAAATGFATVKKITSTPKPKFKQGGGIMQVQGKSHAQGGEDIHIGGKYFGEMEGDEGIGIMNKNAMKHFLAFNNEYNTGTSTATTFAGGAGIISQGVSSQGIDTAELARITQQAVAELPAPIVTVEDINAGQTSVAQVVNGADL